MPVVGCEIEQELYMSHFWSATYRPQMHKAFALSAATEILPYLKTLGNSHVYLSPCLQAEPGSTHGYDVTNPGMINPEPGGESAWTRFVAEAKALRAGEISIGIDGWASSLAISW